MKTTLVSQQQSKQAEQQEIRALHNTTMTDCKNTLRDIVFTEMCGIVRVRNEIITENTAGVTAGDIVDCEVSDWVASPCSLPCDDNLTGGVQNLTREIISINKKNGAPCPPLVMSKTCNQVKCPINCKIGNFTEWSECTNACGGGIRSRSRPQLVKPENGGTACESLTESQPCNTGACDKDCVVGEWTPFTACSKVCDTGFVARQRNVVAPVVGEGTCMAADDPHRLERKPCNPHACVGDEVCMANMDLVIAIDSSGSITQTGFDIMKTYAAKVVRRMKSEAYGHEALRVAVVQFGNGKLGDNNIVSDAIVASPMDAEMEATASAIEGLKFQKGFTNMAQAVIKARTLLQSSARSGSQSAVLLITDGRPTFKLQATKAVKALREQARLMIVQVQSNRKQDVADMLMGFASAPMEANYMWIHGKSDLQAGSDNHVTQTIASLCAVAESPSARAAADKARGFRLVTAGSYCADSGINAPPASILRETAEDCFHFAETQGKWSEFTFQPPKNCVVFQKQCSTLTGNATASIFEPIAPATS